MYKHLSVFLRSGADRFSHLSSRNKRVRGGDADAVSQTGVVQLITEQQVCNYIREREFLFFTVF